MSHLTNGSPWAYDVEIPLMFVGPAVKGRSVCHAGRAAERGTNTRGCAWRAYAANVDGPRIAGPEDGYGCDREWSC